MKKLFYIALIIAGTIVFAVGNIYAASMGSAATGPILLAAQPPLRIQTSKNVWLLYQVDGSTQVEQQNYGISTVHSSGDKEYGTSNNTTQLYFINTSTGDMDPTAVTAGDTTLSGWTSM